MMRLETGETASYKETADYQYARTFLVTFGLMDRSAIKAYIRNYPSGRFLKEAYLEISRSHSLKSEEGRAFFDELVSKFPDDPDVLNVYIENARRDSQSLEGDPVYDKGVELAGRIIEVYPEITRFEAANNYAGLLIGKNDTEAAESVFGEDFLAGQVRLWSDSLLSYAEFWLNRKQNMEGAEEAVVRALNLAPEDPEVLRRAAAAYLAHLGKTDKALQVFGPGILPKIETNARALYDYFKFWTILGANEESAETALRTLWMLKPDTVYYRIGAAEVYRKAGKLERSLAVFGSDFAAQRHNDMSALYEYGMYWLRLKINLESAVPALTRALSLSPSTSINHWNAARMLSKIGKQEAALEVFGPAYLPKIKEDASALSRYADHWTGENLNRESVIEALETAARLENTSSFDRHYLAYTFVRAGLQHRVEEFYGAEYLSEIGSDPQALFFYASFWNHRGQNLSSALEAAERACRIDKDNPQQWSTMAHILMGLVRYEDALKALDKAIGLEKFKEGKESHEPMRKQLLEVLRKKTQV